MPGPRDVQMLVEDVFAPQTEQKSVPSYYADSKLPTPEDADAIGPLLNPVDRELFQFGAQRHPSVVKQKLLEAILGIGRALDQVEGKDRTRPWAK